MQWWFELIPLICGMVYRWFFYGIEKVIGVELGARLLSGLMQVAAFHFGGLSADLSLLVLGFLFRIVAYGTGHLLVELIAFVASVLLRVIVAYWNDILAYFRPPTKEDRTKALIVYQEPLPPVAIFSF